MFEVTCRCGRSTRVAAVQAGLEVRCDCGESVEVPCLSQLRQSALDAGRPIESAPQPRDWTQWWNGVAMLVTGEMIHGMSLILLTFAGATSPVAVALSLAGMVGGWMLGLVGMIAIGRGKGFALGLCLLLFFCVPFGRLLILFVPGKGSDAAADR